MTLADRLLGLLGGGMVIGAIVLLLLGGEGDSGAAAVADRPPAIELLEPRDGDALPAGPLAIVFRVPRELRMQPGGWGVGDHHLHLSLDGVELMPASSDLEPLGTGEYRWTVGLLGLGAHELHLLWSGADHRPIAGTASDTARITIGTAPAPAAYPRRR